MKPKQIIEKLQDYQSQCPYCDSKLNLSEVELFDDKNFGTNSLQYYEQELKKVQKTKERLEGYVKNNFDWLVKNTSSTNFGFIMERIVLTFDSFNYNHNDCRPLFDPIDYIIFEGLTEKGYVENITFVDIKTGNARLKDGQKQIKQTILDKNVKFRTYE